MYVIEFFRKRCRPSTVRQALNQQTRSLISNWKSKNVLRCGCYLKVITAIAGGSLIVSMILFAVIKSPQDDFSEDDPTTTASAVVSKPLKTQRTILGLEASDPTVDIILNASSSN